ncbi:MAG: neutral zinc metallopeptidase [Pseudomonadota bacterium]
MRWEGRRRSENVEDRRGMRVGGKGVAIGGVGTIAFVLIAVLLGVDPSVVLNQLASGPTAVEDQQVDPAARSPEENRLAEFSAVVLADTEDVWSEIFQQSGSQYRLPKMVLFSGAVQSACGFAQSAMGPFYCPGDQKLYLDLSFFQDLHTRYAAPGDFAQAYVIAHEVGHHVQNLMGILEESHAAKARGSEAEANAIQVRVELQADCLAGVWAKRADQSRQILEAGDIEEALSAAAGVGDDRLQQQARGYVVPESFTHGSSEQRMRWFKIGEQSGDPNQCNTFKVARL